MLKRIESSIDHQEEHKIYHKYLLEIFKDWIDNTNKSPTRCYVLDLSYWSEEQSKNPDHKINHEQENDAEFDHKKRHKFLHKHLNDLIWDWNDVTDHFPSKTYIVNLIEWSFQQSLELNHKHENN